MVKCCCDICGESETVMLYGVAKRLAKDHCHKTGVVRGTLCQRCNTGLGLFRDDAGLLQKAIVYLQKNHETQMELRIRQSFIDLAVYRESKHG